MLPDNIVQQDKNLTFIEKYEFLRNRYPSLPKLDDVITTRIENEIDLEKIRKAYNTRQYIVVTTTILFLFATFPILVSKAYDLAVAWEQQLSIFDSYGYSSVTHPNRTLIRKHTQVQFLPWLDPPPPPLPPLAQHRVGFH